MLRCTAVDGDAVVVRYGERKGLMEPGGDKVAGVTLFFMDHRRPGMYLLTEFTIPSLPLLYSHRRDRA